MPHLHPYDIHNKMELEKINHYYFNFNDSPLSTVPIEILI